LQHKRIRLYLSSRSTLIRVRRRHSCHYVCPQPSWRVPLETVSSQADSASLIGPVTHSRRVCTATKYRNTPTATCYPAGLIAALPCSATGSHRPKARPLPGGGFGLVRTATALIGGTPPASQRFAVRLRVGIRRSSTSRAALGLRGRRLDPSSRAQQPMWLRLGNESRAFRLAACQRESRTSSWGCPRTGGRPGIR